MKVTKVGECWMTDYGICTTDSENSTTTKIPFYYLLIHSTSFYSFLSHKKNLTSL